MEPHLRPNRFQGKKQLRRKENSSQGSRRRLRVRSRYRPPSTHWLWNINQIPFRRTDEESSRSAELSCLLGSAHPCPTAVHMEPFSTSVFEVLIRIFATTTKICTGVRFTQAHAQGCVTTATPSYSSALRIYADGRLSATRFSAIHFQG